MTRWFSACALVLAAAGGFAVVFQPVLTLGVIGACLSALVFVALPRERLALFSGVAVFTLLILIPVQNVAIFGNLKYVVLGMVAALAIGTLLRRRESFEVRPRGLWLFVAYFAVIALATPRSLEPASWNLYFGILIAGIAPAIIFAMMSTDERNAALKWIVGLASLESAYAIFEMLARPKPLWGYASITSSGDPNLMHNQIVTTLIRAQGTMGHPLPLALLLLVALALVIRGIGPSGRLAKALLVAVLFVGCFAAGSRSALAVAVLLVFLGIGRQRMKAIAVGGYLLGLSLLYAFSLGAFESEAFERFTGSDSVSHRAGALDAVPGLLEKQDLFSTVFGNGYFSAYQLFRAGFLQRGHFFAIDNQFVMTLVEGGLLGLAALAVLIFVAMKKIDPAIRLGFLSVVAFFLTFDVLSWPSGMVLFATFVGLAFSAPASQDAGAETPTPLKVSAGVAQSLLARR